MAERLQARVSRSCDNCKAKKIRCLQSPTSQICTPCQKRNIKCHFSLTRRQLKAKKTNALPSPASKYGSGFSLTSTLSPANDSRLYVDHILVDRHADGRNRDACFSSVFKTREDQVPGNGMAFFSESHISSMTNILGHTRLQDLLENMGNLIYQRAYEVGITFSPPKSPIQIPREDTFVYMAAYFNEIHPLSPFLDQEAFEKMALGPDLSELLDKSAPFSALYHTVLALGCQCTEGGSFDPGEGKAWGCFQVALGLFPQILVPLKGLVHVQALTAMGIFAMSFSCIQIGETLVSEAARIVQVLGYNAAYVPKEDETACHRVFWVIYWQERLMCFFRGRASTIPEYDIGCPVPCGPDTGTGQLDWLLTTARLGRLMSRVYESLFSVSAVQMDRQARIETIDSVSHELEAWRRSLPEEFQPDHPLRCSKINRFSTSPAQEMKMQLRFIYYALFMSNCRLRIYLKADQQSESDQETKIQLMETARVIIYHGRYIDHEPHVPVWKLAIIPISALFVIFDFVIHNPFHKETNRNLAFLDIAAGYFSRWEINTKGSMPAFSISEFCCIAREFVRNLHDRPQPQFSAAPPRKSDQMLPMTTQPQESSDIASARNQDSNSLAPQIFPMVPNFVSSLTLRSDHLSYPDDPLQPILGTSMQPMADWPFIFNASYWNFYSSSP